MAPANKIKLGSMRGADFAAARDVKPAPRWISPTRPVRELMDLAQVPESRRSPVFTEITFNLEGSPTSFAFPSARGQRLSRNGVDYSLKRAAADAAVRRSVPNGSTHTWLGTRRVRC